MVCSLTSVSRKYGVFDDMFDDVCLNLSMMRAHNEYHAYAKALRLFEHYVEKAHKLHPKLQYKHGGDAHSHGKLQSALIELCCFCGDIKSAPALDACLNNEPPTRRSLFWGSKLVDNHA